MTHPAYHPPWWKGLAGVGIPVLLCGLVGAAFVAFLHAVQWLCLWLARWYVGLVVLLMLGATPAWAGYRNLLLELPNYPPDGYHPGESAAVRIITQEYVGNVWRPLPGYHVRVTVYRPNPNGATYLADWVWTTDGNGLRDITVELLPSDQPGRWQVQANLLDPLPDGTSDGDGTAFEVTP